MTIPLHSMAKVKQRLKTSKQTLSFLSPADLCTFRSIFGQLSMFGLQKKTGHLGEPCTTLSSNDFIHYVKGFEQHNELNNQQANKAGIQLCCNSSGAMSITVHYAVYVYRHDSDGRAQNVPLPELEDTLQSTSPFVVTNPQGIHLDDLFAYRGAIYKVVSVVAEAGQVIAVPDTSQAANETITFDIHEAARLINDYLE